MRRVVAREDQQREEQPREEWKCDKQQCIRIVQEKWLCEKNSVTKTTTVAHMKHQRQHKKAMPTTQQHKKSVQTKY